MRKVGHIVLHFVRPKAAQDFLEKIPTQMVYKLEELLEEEEEEVQKEKETGDDKNKEVGEELNPNVWTKTKYR